MQERHKDRKRYFDEQALTTEKYVVPYIEKHVELADKARVLEVGCGEGGNMLPFVERGYDTVGVDLSASQIEFAKQYLSETKYDNWSVHASDIYLKSSDELGKFDLIFLRDVIEHIPYQEKFMKHIKEFLSDTGVIFFGFPPWRMPFGGHQQICISKLASVTPYVHILPKPLYKLWLKLLGESDATIESLMEIKDTGISIHRFKKAVKGAGYRFVSYDAYLINPNYQTKFGLKGRKLWGVFKFPWLQDFYTTAIYSIIKK